MRKLALQLDAVALISWTSVIILSKPGSYFLGTNSMKYFDCRKKLQPVCRSILYIFKIKYNFNLFYSCMMCTQPTCIVVFQLCTFMWGKLHLLQMGLLCNYGRHRSPPKRPVTTWFCLWYSPVDDTLLLKFILWVNCRVLVYLTSSSSFNKEDVVKLG